MARRIVRPVTLGDNVLTTVSTSGNSGIVETLLRPCASLVYVRRAYYTRPIQPSFGVRMETSNTGTQIGIVQPQQTDLAAEELAAVEKLQKGYHNLKAELGKVIVGQEAVIEELLISL